MTTSPLNSLSGLLGNLSSVSRESQKGRGSAYNDFAKLLALQMSQSMNDSLGQLGSLDSSSSSTNADDSWMSLLQPAGQSGLGSLQSLLTGQTNADDSWMSLLQPAGQSGLGSLQSLLTGQTNSDSLQALLQLTGQSSSDPLQSLLQSTSQSSSDPLQSLLQSTGQSGSGSLQSLLMLQVLEKLDHLLERQQPPLGLPAEGPLSQAYHPGHNGLDIAVAEGTPVQATQSGQVTYAGWNTEGYGNLVIVDNGLYQTYYAHLSQVPVTVGQAVEAGATIGLSGNTGNSTGPHIHYETRVNGQAVEPLTTAAGRAQTVAAAYAQGGAG